MLNENLSPLSSLDKLKKLTLKIYMEAEKYVDLISV